MPTAREEEERLRRERAAAPKNYGPAGNTGALRPPTPGGLNDPAAIRAAVVNALAPVEEALTPAAPKVGMPVAVQPVPAFGQYAPNFGPAGNTGALRPPIAGGLNDPAAVGAAVANALTPAAPRVGVPAAVQPVPPFGRSAVNYGPAGNTGMLRPPTPGGLNDSTPDALARGLGQAVAPGTSAVLRGTADEMAALVKSGNPWQAAGQGLRGLATLPVAAADDFIARPVMAAGRAIEDSGIAPGIANAVVTAATGDNRPMFGLPRVAPPAAIPGFPQAAAATLPAPGQPPVAQPRPQVPPPAPAPVAPAPVAPAAVAPPPVVVGTKQAGTVAAPPIGAPGVPAPAVSPAVAAQAIVANQLDPNAPPGAITRTGNSYSGTNITGEAIINGRPAGGGFMVSEQNERAAQNLSDRFANRAAAPMTDAPARVMGTSGGYGLLDNQSQRRRELQMATTSSRSSFESKSGYRSRIQGAANALQELENEFTNRGRFDADRDERARGVDVTAGTTRRGQDFGLNADMLRERGALARLGITDATTRSGQEATNALARSRLGMEQTTADFANRNSARMEAAQLRLQSATTPEAKAAATAELRALQGKDPQTRMTVVPGGQEPDPMTGAPITRPARLYDNQNQRFVDEAPAAAAAAPMPASAAQAVQGKVYQTKNGPARWDGTKFIPV